jgi:hypothetical protein
LAAQKLLLVVRAGFRTVAAQFLDTHTEVHSMDANHLSRRVGLVVVSLLIAPGSAAEPAVGWRYDGSGRYPAAEPPNGWSAEKNVLWKSSSLGRAISSPVVVGERVFSTADPAE